MNRFFIRNLITALCLIAGPSCLFNGTHLSGTTENYKTGQRASPLNHNYTALFVSSEIKSSTKEHASQKNHIENYRSATLGLTFSGILGAVVAIGLLVESIVRTKRIISEKNNRLR